MGSDSELFQKVGHLLEKQGYTFVDIFDAEKVNELHVYLRMHDCFIGAGFKNTVNKSRILTSILSEALLEHVGNSIDHIKMLPIYESMGFDKRLFIQDFEVHKCPSDIIQEIKRHYKVGKKFNSGAVDLLVGKIFAVRLVQMIALIMR